MEVSGLMKKNEMLMKKPEIVKKQDNASSLFNHKKRVLIVDDHPLFRQGITQFINREADLGVIGEAESSDQALQAIQDLKPDMLTLDISLKDSNGIDLIKSIKAQYEELPILVLSMHDETLYAERVLRAGAKGYIMKQEATKNVMVAIRRVLEGKIYLSDTMSEKMLEKQLNGVPENTSSVGTLSDRELEVFQAIGEGQSTSHIAKNLHLSVKTVETYRANIKNKLNLSNNTELIRHAVQWVQCGKEI
jgi:DNA-binding NarL/FixJ family response regulator